jgi:predicted SnoaL-like aldol condensation-catalyzing enzyme
MGSQDQKRVVRAFFKLVARGKQKSGLRFFAADCKQHNPYVRGGMDALFDSMAAAQSQSQNYPDPYFAIKSILADGDMVAAHTEFLASRSKPEQGGLRQVHLFRFGKNNMIVEYWDITQQITPGMSSAANAF